MFKAKAADQIADPLARCMAFPDIPRNQWPAGLARTQCELTYGPHITPNQIGQYLDRGATAELDALFARDLERHFSKTDFSEVIHADFNPIDASEASDQLTERWLKMAPESAFARMARARYLRVMAGEVRGDKYVSETPRKNLRQMSEFAGQAIDLYEKALAVEPRLMPAYGGLISAGMVDSRPEVIRSAFERSEAIDSTCMPVTASMITALRPEWGGDYPTMVAYAEKLYPEMQRRPLLALVVFEPFIAKSDALYNAKRYQESMDTLLAVAPKSTSPEIFEDLARAMAEVAPDERRWEIIMYLLEVTRFQRPRGWAGRELGRDLVYTAAENDWSVMVLERSVAKEPDNAMGHRLLADSYSYVQRVAEAEQQYELAAKGPDERPNALAALYRLAMGQKQVEKARGYYETLEKEFPDYAAKSGIVAP